MSRFDELPLHCECTWRYHRGAACLRAPYDPGGGIVSSPALCPPCLFACEGERDDENDQGAVEVTGAYGQVLSTDQQAVLKVLREAPGPMSPAQVAGVMGSPRTPAGAGQTLSSLHRHGLVEKFYGHSSALYRLSAAGLA